MKGDLTCQDKFMQTMWMQMVKYLKLLVKISEREQEHGNIENKKSCKSFITVKNSFFKNKGFYVDPIPSDSEQTGVFLFCNNSVETKLPTDSNGWELNGWNNVLRSSN